MTRSLPDGRSGVRASSRRLGALTALSGLLLTGSLLVGSLLSGCGAAPVPVAAERIDGLPATGVPFVRIDGGGTSTPAVPDGLSPDETAALSVLTDLAVFASGMPGVAEGVLAGGYAAVDAGAVTGPVLCLGRAADLLGTAFFCPEQDTVVADSVALIPALRGHDGDGALALALAHEYGHAVQAKAGWVTPGAPALLVELQADCFAGAFLGRVTAGSAEHVHIPAESRVRVIAPLLDFRDAPGSDPDAASAHGSAVDRFRALDGGLRLGAASCSSMTGDQVLASTTLGAPGPDATSGAETMTEVLASAGLTPPATDPTTPADLDGTDVLGPVARESATALAQADAATGDDAPRASCLLGAWAGSPARRTTADQALDYLRSRTDTTYPMLQAFSTGIDGGASSCG